MKRILALILILVICGCVTVRIPKYLEGEFPYRRSFEANFQNTFDATLKALKDSGWKVTETTSPAVFAPGRTSDKTKKYEILVFTEIKQSAMVLASSYVTLNALLRSTDANHTEVEIRYLSMTAMFFKTVNSYQNDRVVGKIFKKIEQILKNNF